MKLYQDCNLFIKIYRWLRWKPWYGLLTLLWIIRYKCRYIKVGKYSIDIWIYYMSMADIKMNHLYSIEEIKNEL